MNDPENSLMRVGDTRAEVDARVAQAVAPGGSAPRTPHDHGLAHAHRCQNPDGPVRELVATAEASA